MLVTVAYGFQIGKPEKIEFKDKIPVNPKSIVVMDNEWLIVTDGQEGDIKVYQKNKKLFEWQNTIGQKGYGVDEFSEPICSDFSQNKLSIMDIGLRKIFIYDRIGATDFKRISEVPCIGSGNAIKMLGDKVIVSGYIEDEKNQNQPYEIYSIDWKTNQTDYILPFHIKYGFKNMQEYNAQYYGKPDMIAIGNNGWFDIHDSTLLYGWEGSLRIIKSDLNSAKKDCKVIDGTKPKIVKYFQPYASKEMLEARKKRNFVALRNEKKKMSYIRNIFTTSSNILIVIEGPGKQEGETYFIVQSYTFSGQLVGEKLLSDKPGNIMWFDKSKGYLYSLTSELTNDLNFYILRYKIY